MKEVPSLLYTPPPTPGGLWQDLILSLYEPN